MSTANADIALLLPSNEPAASSRPANFPDYLPVDEMVSGSRGPRKFTKFQQRTIDTRKQMALKLVSQGVPMNEVATLARMQYSTLQALVTQEWQKASLDTKALSNAFKQAGAICASQAMGKLTDAPFRDLANAATGFVARATDMDVLSQMGVFTQSDPQALSIESSSPDQQPRDRVRRLLAKSLVGHSEQQPSPGLV